MSWAFNKADWLLRATCAALLLLLAPAAHSGDILRGGAPSGASTKRTANSGASAGADTAAAVKANARDRLARTNAALDAVKALQRSAREATATTRLKNTTGRLPGVRDGLDPRGLDPADGIPKNLRKPKPGEDPSLWIGAKLPTESGKKGGTKTVTIVQTEQQALLTWKKFDIGKKTTLVFDQSKGGRDTGKWIAFNKINDPTGRPSQILGTLKADGQVYIINQNGIIFGPNSQVNTHSLTASALPINHNLINSGLLDNPGAEFLFNYQRKESLLASISAGNPSATFSDILDSDTTPQIEVSVRDNANLSNFTLVPDEDYTLSVGKDRRTTLTLTAAGIAKAFPSGANVTTETFSATFGALAGNVEVQKGAQLTSPTSAANVGGRITLVGKNVTNRGTIETPDGQTILAAGLQVGFAAHSGDDPGLRGLDTYIGVVSDPTAKQPKIAGETLNAGLIDVPRGNATLAGASVRQNGFIESSTSVELNGSINLLASYDTVGNPVFEEGSSTASGRLFVSKSTGAVRLGKGGVMRILPEYESDAKRVGTSLTLPSRIDIRGKAIHLGLDSTIHAPNASVAINAGEWFFTEPANVNSPPASEFVYTNGQIYADRGSLIDVSGTADAFAPLSENILTLQLRGAEVADSPLQREGPFRATDANQVSLTVDIRKTGNFNGREWAGTPLADVTGFANLIERSVGELTKDGGSVTLNAGRSVVLQRDSTIDVSGGYLNYEGGFVETSRVAVGSQIIDIADATPDLVYDGLYTAQFTKTHDKWGVSRTYKNPFFDLNSRHYESSYVAGGAGGSITIKAPSMAVDGRLRGNTVAGPRQVRDFSGRTSLPQTSKLDLEFSKQELIDVGGALQAQRSSPTPPKIFFDAQLSQQAVEPFVLDDFGSPLALDSSRRRKLVLSPDLVNSDGFGSLTIENVEGAVVVNKGVELKTQPGGLIDFQAARVDIRGDISAPGGDLSFTAYQVSPYRFERLKKYLDPQAGPEYDSTTSLPGNTRTNGRFFLRPGASLSTAGLVVDGRFSAEDPFGQPLQAAGGAVTIAAFEANLARGSVVDVSGGVEVGTKGDVHYGDAGSITVLAGRDPGERGDKIGTFQSGTEAIAGGRLVLNGELRGYSGATGGSLALQAMRVRVGSQPIDSPTVFSVTPDFFNRGGFTSFSLAGIGSIPTRRDPFLADTHLPPETSLREIPDYHYVPGLVIESGLHLEPRVANWVASIVGEEGIRLDTTRLPEGLRAPVSLAFEAKGSRDYLNVPRLVRGDLEFGEGTLVNAGPRGNVSLKGDTVSVLGSVDAPGGAISVRGASRYPLITGAIAPSARATVYIGAGSRLNAAGTVVYEPDPFGHRVGSVLPGGSISIAGNVIAEPSSLLDVSGTSAVLDLRPEQIDFTAPAASATSGLTRPLFSRLVVPVQLDSDGGSISLAGGEMLFVESALRGQAGGPTALGGSLAVSSGRFYADGEIALPTDVNLLVRQDGGLLPKYVPLKDKSDDGDTASEATARKSSKNPPLVLADRGIGSKVFRTDGSLMPARGYFMADHFAEGGFDSLDLGGVVRFSGSVLIDARQSLSVAKGGVLVAADAVKLRAPYVALGMPFTDPLRPEDTRLTDPLGANRPFYFNLRRGPGSLTVEAKLIDIGTLAVRGVNVTTLLADGGDIRGQGVLAVPGDLRIRAGQVYPVSGGKFTISAFDYRLAPLPHDQTEPFTKSQLKMHPGSITIVGSGDRQLPLSAGGELNVFASRIVQGGVLRAPLGTINLGWDGTGDTRRSALVGSNEGSTGQPVADTLPVTRKLVLGAGSETSVSAVDSGTGRELLIPYGLVTSSDSWVDPRGIDITVGGVPSKTIRLSAKRLNAGPGSVVDVSGGGNLYAYRWIRGQGGSRDLLASDRSFAVLPGYQSNFAPFSPFNRSDLAQQALNPTFSSTGERSPGFANSSLGVGDRVRLGASAGLPAGDYTLLPARYALLPGAFLITPQDGVAMGRLDMPDGSSLVSGYLFNNLNTVRKVSGLSTRFEVAPAEVVRSRAEYESFFANTYLRRKAREVDAVVPRLPRDAGRLVFQATKNMRLNSTVNTLPAAGGIGASIDISSPLDILIVDRKPLLTPEDTIVLSASRLSSWGAESLLIGGVREPGAEGTTLTVQTGDITLANRRTALSGPEIILASRESLTLKDGASVAQTGRMTGSAERLLVDGDGLLLRVSSDPSAKIARSGITASTTPIMTIGANASISGTSLILDSSSATSLSASARLLGDYVSLNSGRITLQLDQFGDVPKTTGLVLAGRALSDLQGVKGLSLLSYSSIDIVGAGRFAIDGKLELHAGEIRGFDQGDGDVRFQAASLVLDNMGRGVSPGRTTGASGSLTFSADTIEIGRGRVDLDHYDAVNLNAADHVLMTGRGRVFAQNNLTVRTPVVTGENSATTTIRAGGELKVLASEPLGERTFTPGLGASLTLQGDSVSVSSDVIYPSGLVTLRATEGNVNVNGRLDVGGVEIGTFDRLAYTDGGRITLDSGNGSVNVGKSATLTVAAQKGGGNAGTLSISTPRGELTLDGAIFGQGGKNGTSGIFLLDVQQASRLASLNDVLDAASFFERRSFRVREGDVLLAGKTAVHRFDLSADAGSITLTGEIDASGETGGRIRLQAHGDVILADGSRLSVAGEDFDAAGKGGSILLEAGTARDGLAGSGFVDIRSGSLLDLSVASASGTSESMGQFQGILHLRAPRTAGNDDLQIAPINGDIRGASHIIAEGYKIYDLNPALTPNSSGTISTAIRTQMRNDAISFLGNAGQPATVGYTAMLNRLLAGNADLDPIFSIRAGLEVINRSGNLTLGAQGSGADNDWNLQGYRFGPKSAPGVLTMKASGDLVFFNALQDGFEITNEALAFRAPLLQPNANLPANAQSWSFRLTAGADLTAADFAQVQPLASLAGVTGSLRLGKFVARGGISSSSGANATTLSAVTGSSQSSVFAIQPNTPTRYQVIRTGSGDIEVAAGRDVQLLNQFATIYTAGTLIADPTLGGTFDVPINSTQGVPSNTALGTSQQPFNATFPFPVQYTIGGGNVSLFAGNDIAHYIRTSSGAITDDSSRELPMNWLYRRGFVDPASGEFGTSFRGEIASTTWWMDFANFFEGVGALGGGNVTLEAGRDVRNVDAVIPTNARMPKGAPSDEKMVELGGGDLVVSAGRDINAGVYYVERGTGTLDAGGSIITNSTRSPSATILASEDPLAVQTWLPTTLFVGKGKFNLSARGDIILGPVSNPFLLASGINNGYWYKSYFSTYAPTASVDVSSLGGSVTLRQQAGVGSNTSTAEPLLYLWMRDVLRYRASPSSVQPWLRLNESSVDSLQGVASLMPGALRVQALSGDINIVGDLTLSPAPRGTLDLVAKGSINGLQPSGYDRPFNLLTWSSSRITVSDASPAALPRATSPFSYQSSVSSIASMRTSGIDFLQFVDLLFEETGSVNQVLATKQTLHSAGLHLEDTEPLRLYADNGSISGLTLFSPKRARILAGGDITDISFYIQNLTADDVTTIAAGRNITAYSANSTLRSAAFSAGNIIAGSPASQSPQPGDIQLSGPGTLEILAGRDLDLGTGASNADGTAAGITTIGNRRNPFLPFDGADVLIAAGIGPATSLLDSALDFESFLDAFGTDDGFATFAAEKMADLGESAGSFDIETLTPEQQSRLALDYFFRILRDTGRDRADPTSPNYLQSSAYDPGYEAIATLFGQRNWKGDVLAQGRDIRTRNGGDISIIVPGGELRLADVVIGNPQIPPGIITEAGGAINIMTDQDVSLGVGRIFTLQGGDMVIWSSAGDIAAGAASRTVASAPPARVIIDAQSADLETDLAGLSTGGGIGALATVAGVDPASIDLIAPVGTVDAGDAGIRASGNITIAAETVLNASNISAGGTVAGPPSAPTVSAPNIAGLSSASNATAGTNAAADSVANQARNQAGAEDTPSVITVEVVGYGGGDDAPPGSGG